MSLTHEQAEVVLSILSFLSGATTVHLVGKMRMARSAPKAGALAPVAVPVSTPRKVVAPKASSLDKYFVPAADDPRWEYRIDELLNVILTCGPFLLSASTFMGSDSNGFLFIDDDMVLGVALTDARQRFDAILAAQGRPPVSSAARAAQAEQAQRDAALNWHRANEPKSLPPDSAELPERPFR